MILSNLKRKTMAMYANLCNVYRDEGEKEETCKEELQGDFAEDMTAALIALFILYRKVVDQAPVWRKEFEYICGKRYY